VFTPRGTTSRVMDEFNTWYKCTGFYRRSLETFRSHLVIDAR
jgi:hypothetical protein